MASSVSASTSSTTTSASTSALFQTSGIASGLDSASIVNKLIESQSGPLNHLKQRQTDYEVQISTLGTLVTQLKALQTSASNLSANGVVAILPTETFSDFTVTGSAKAEGSYTINVEQVAQEAKMRSTSFASAQDAAVVPAGELKFNIDGTDSVTINTAGKTLADIAEAINQSVSSLNASVISTTSGYYLNVSRRETGFSTTAEAALTVVSDPGLGLTLRQEAKNAKLSVDGLSVERQSNTVSDVVSGVTFHLTHGTNTDSKVTFAANSAGTKAALADFVTAYNALGATVRSQLVTQPGVAYGETLLDHSAMASIQSTMQRMLSQYVAPSGSVRILADLGLEMQTDGSILLNSVALDSAISKDPGAVNAIFSTSKTGIAEVINALVTNQTSLNKGALVLTQKSLESSISDMDDRATQMQSNLDATRTRLVAQFTAMEQLISGFNAATSYLTQVANLKIQG